MREANTVRIAAFTDGDGRGDRLFGGFGGRAGLGLNSLRHDPLLGMI